MTISESLCPSCGEPLEAGARFCVDCGTEVPAVSLKTRKLAEQPDSDPESRAESPPDSGEKPEAAQITATGTASGSLHLSVPCPSCSKPVTSGKRFCGDCGARVEAETETQVPDREPTLKICQSCRFENPSDSVFCSNCGESLSPEQAEMTSEQLARTAQMTPPQPSEQTSSQQQLPEPAEQAPAEDSKRPPLKAALQAPAEMSQQSAPGLPAAAIQDDGAAGKKCPSCAAENAADSLFCIICGTAIPVPLKDGASPRKAEASGKDNIVSAKPIPPPPKPPAKLQDQEPAVKSDGKGISAGETDGHRKMMRYGGIIIICVALILAIVALAKKPDDTKPVPDHYVPSQSGESPSSAINQNGNNGNELVRVVYDNFNAINDKDFRKVYDLRSERLRRKNSPDHYRDIYRENLAIDINKAEIQEDGISQARVSVSLTSYDIFNKVKMKSTYRGWFLLIKEQNRWLIDDSDLQLTGESRADQ
jgi:predicted amidophosphoribosyltransferase